MRHPILSDIICRLLVAAGVIVAAVILLPAPTRAAPGWCGNAGLTATEVTICTDEGLSRLDARLEALRGAPGSGTAGVSLQQREWLVERNRCGVRIDCIEAAYLDRIAAMTPPEQTATAPQSVEQTAAAPQGLLRPWCDGTLNPSERTICATPRLADFDAALGAVYGSVKARDSDAAQMTWLRDRRDACGTDVECLLGAYVERIGDLGARIRTR